VYICVTANFYDAGRTPVFRAQTFLNGRNIKEERRGEGVICGYGFCMAKKAKK
jgi:hypothetical protein